MLLLARFDESLPIPHPLRVVAWVLVFGYSFKSLYLAYAIPAGMDFRTSKFTADHIHIGQAMVLAGSVSLALGYFALRRYKIGRANQFFDFSSQVVKALYWSVFSTAFAAVVAYFYVKGLYLEIATLKLHAAKFYVSEATGTKSALGFLLIGFDIIVVYFFYYLAIGGRFLKPNIYSFAVLFVALNYFLSSQRAGILMIIVGEVLINRRCLFSLKPRTNLMRLACIGLILAVLSTAGDIRKETQEARRYPKAQTVELNKRDAGVPGAKEAELDTGDRSVSAFDISVIEGVQTTLKQVFHGAYAIDPAKLTAIEIRNPEFLMGKSFGMFLVAPIPRILWPEKPAVRVGPYVAQEILDYQNMSGAPPSAIGEFYINFGWLGVLLGMFGLGAITSLMRSAYTEARYPALGRVRYALMLMVFINFLVGDFSYAVLSGIKYAFAAFFCEMYWVARMRPTRRRSPIAASSSA